MTQRPRILVVRNVSPLSSRRRFLRLTSASLGTLALYPSVLLVGCGDDDDSETGTGDDNTDTGNTDTGSADTGSANDDDDASGNDDDASGDDDDGGDDDDDATTDSETGTGDAGDAGDTGDNGDTAEDSGNITGGDTAETDGDAGDTGDGEKSRYFYFAMIADSHIKDAFWDGGEGNALDASTIRDFVEIRLTKARDTINAFPEKIEAVFHLGDVLHDPSSGDYDFYFENTTCFDNAKAIFDGFNMPLHLLLGNHDYNLGTMSRELTQQLFAEKLGLKKSYYNVDLHGFNFIMLDCYRGETMNPDNPAASSINGSLGEEQLLFLEAQLQRAVPSLIMVHQPMPLMQENEVRDLSLRSLQTKYKDTVLMSAAGHWHRWFDFGRTYGARSWAIGSTRYDEDAIWFFRADKETGKIEQLNKQPDGVTGVMDIEPFVYEKM